MHTSLVLYSLVCQPPLSSSNLLFPSSFSLDVQVWGPLLYYVAHILLHATQPINDGELTNLVKRSSCKTETPSASLSVDS